MRFVWILFVVLFLHESAAAISWSRRTSAIFTSIKKPFSVQVESASHSTKHSKHGVTHHGTSAKDPHHNMHVYVMIPQHWCRFLYLLSAVNPFLAVFFNDYSQMCVWNLIPHILPATATTTTHHHHPVNAVLSRTYETIFFFARLRPRISFAMGAALRALQLTSALQYVFDPCIGIGLGLNLLCLYAKSQWPATIVLGWTMTQPFWKILGACPPSGLPVPIRISLKEINSNSNNNSNQQKKDSDGVASTKGYRIGL